MIDIARSVDGPRLARVESQDQMQRGPVDLDGLDVGYRFGLGASACADICYVVRRPATASFFLVAAGLAAVTSPTAWPRLGVWPAPGRARLDETECGACFR